ncbi:hypothetical protein NLM24_12475 [Nocardia zapadnayensis]|uniref:hypothetical protein n=1 Tax=Nocardia rhamnosiphila TaxID=426716 RepID=UPI0022475C1B|nr:hypothetical protein [Nocardia zapadnayensis]MCX0271510.1 hypothetical protein [Nocardia zapadnayensis]
MRIRFGSTHMVDQLGAARVRGAAAGLISGAVSVAAHGWADRTSSPDGTAVVLLALAAAAVGALVTGLRPLRTGTTGLATALTAGQLLGHLSLGWSSGHLHHGDLQPTPAMFAAHVVVACAAAVVVRGAEFAYRVVATALARLVPVAPPPPALPDPPPLRLLHRDRVVAWILAADTGRTRAPPRAVLI